jgi:hypothetical protein
MLLRLLDRATFYDGFITSVTVAVTTLMVIFAYYLGAFEHTESTLVVIAGVLLNVILITGATISRVRRLLSDDD